MAVDGGAGGADRNALAKCETNAAAALVTLGRTTEARAACDRAIAIREGLLKELPADATVAQGLAESLLRSGHARAAAGDLAGAAADWRRAAALYAAHPPVGESAIVRGLLPRRPGGACRQAGRRRVARRGDLAGRGGNRHPSPSHRRGLS